MHNMIHFAQQQTYWAHRIQKPYEDSIMFKNEYQGGPHVDVFSAQGKDPVAKWRLFGGQSAIWKDFDKEVKSFVFVLEGSSQTIKMQLPKENKQMLGLIQRFLVLQLYIPLGQDFSAELLITDLANIKRRLYLSTVHKELSATPLHAKIPLSIIRRRVWCNLCIDLVAFTSGIFKSAVFQSLDGITISANCKLRKIYTMKLKPQDTVEQDIYESVLSDCEPTDTIPRSCQITTDVKQVTQVLDLSRVRNNEVREDGKFVLSTEADLLTHRGQGSSRDFKRGDKSHIAFGSKVLGPPPAPGRKASARSPGESTRSTSRHERSLQLLTQEKGASSLGHTTDTRIMSPTLYHPSDQRNKENIQQTKKKEPRPRGIDYHPHPPTDPLTNEKGRRLRTVGSAKKEQSKPVPDSSSVGHCRNEDKLSVQIHMPSCERENRPKTSSNAGADITDDWIFPDSFQDVSKLSDTLHQTYIGNLCEQLAGNSETDTVYPEERTPGDPDNIFSFSSMSGSVHHGKLQGQSFDRDTVSLEGLEHDRRGARMEDDFYGSDNSIEAYNWRSYNVNRLSASEMQMLASLKRQQNEEMEDEGTSHGLSQSQIDHCNISMSTSSDDTTTWNSCLPPPVNQGSHYQTEMNPLAQSNPRDWLNAFSPPIIPTSQNQNKDPLLKLKESRLNCNEGDDGIGADEEEDILTLLYDPCLNCYFDPETGKYYELA
ncbi:protein CFAP20DC isoform X7 [Hyla sarda]|uniref:protein CFAP20DC isoform X7 n=1 Tax=Hyla sarda TaxID=327740 RepID=UPI0024C321F5|nr:protein CFAP20DC isoform X7 [Hyla sarda]